MLWLTVSLSSCGGGGTSKTTLGVPLQVGVDPADASSGGEGAERPPSFEAAMEAAEAEAHLRPRRTFRAPLEGGDGLPGYGDGGGWRTVAAGP